MDLQPPQQPTPELQPHKNFLARHILAEVLGVVVFIAVIVGAYYYQSSNSAPVFIAPVHHAQTDATASWKTYTNTQFDFNFKYPNNWIAKNVDTNVIYISESTEEMPGGGVSISKNSETLVDFIKNLNTNFLVTSSEDRMINSIAWKKLIQEDKVSKISSVTYASEEGNNSVVTLSAIEKPQEDSFIEQILSTFKFLDTVFCGGIAGFPCPTTGFICTPEGNYPDAGTTCIRQNSLADTSTYDSKNDTTIAGQDNDSNGIRDDIDVYIAATYSASEKFQKASQQYALVLQQIIVNYTNTQLLKTLWSQDNNAVNCILDIFGSQATNARGLLRAKMLNTELRSQAYLTAGKVTPDANTLDELNNPTPTKYSTCNFDPTKLRN